MRRALACLVLAGALCAPAAAGAARIEPPPDARWQYQLQAIAKGGFDTGRVDVGICGRPPGLRTTAIVPSASPASELSPV